MHTDLTLRSSFRDNPRRAITRSRHRQHQDPIESQPLTTEYLAAQDCVLIATVHKAHDYAVVVVHRKLVIDTRNVTKTVNAEHEKFGRAGGGC